MTAIRYDEFGIASFKLAEWLEKNEYQIPNILTNNPYKYAHDIQGLNMFEFISKVPVRLKNFNNAMKAKTISSILEHNLYPFKEEFSTLETTDETVLLVDVGGGDGQAVAAIRELCPGIKGRIILQDQPQVIERIPDPLPGVDTMGYNFFAPQPVSGMK